MAFQEKRALYVGGLSEEVTLDILKAAFIPFGNIKDAQLPIDNNTGKIRGFGFVEFEEEEDAAEAVINMDGSELFGQTIRVNVARPSRGKAQAIWSDAVDWYESLKEKEEASGE